MKVSALLGVFAVTVIVLAVAWAICLNPDGDSLLPLGVGVLIGFGIQVFGWRSLSQFPEAYAKLLRIAFPLAATLIAVPLGLFVIGFFLNSLYPEPHHVDLGWGFGVSMVIIGQPSLVMGVVLLLVCVALWKRGLGC